MALTQDDFVGAVTKLNELTRQQVIKWLPCNFPSKAPVTKNAFVGPYEAKYSYETAYEDRILRITEYVAPGVALIGNVSHKYVLDLRDQDGNVVFEFPDVAGIADLFWSVQTGKVDIEGFIRKLVAG